MVSVSRMSNNASLKINKKLHREVKRHCSANGKIMQAWVELAILQKLSAQRPMPAKLEKAMK